MSATTDQAMPVVEMAYTWMKNGQIVLSISSGGKVTDYVLPVNIAKAAAQELISAL